MALLRKPAALYGCCGGIFKSPTGRCCTSEIISHHAAASGSKEKCQPCKACDASQIRSRESAPQLTLMCVRLCVQMTQYVLFCVHTEHVRPARAGQT